MNDEKGNRNSDDESSTTSSSSTPSSCDRYRKTQQERIVEQVVRRRCLESSIRNIESCHDKESNSDKCSPHDESTYCVTVFDIHNSPDFIVHQENEKSNEDEEPSSSSSTDAASCIDNNEETWPVSQENDVSVGFMTNEDTMSVDPESQTNEPPSEDNLASNTSVVEIAPPTLATAISTRIIESSIRSRIMGDSIVVDATIVQNNSLNTLHLKIVITLIMIVIVAGVSFGTTRDNEKSTIEVPPIPTAAPSSSPGIWGHSTGGEANNATVASPPETLTSEQQDLLEYLIEISDDNGEALLQHMANESYIPSPTSLSSPQYRAFFWLARTMNIGIGPSLNRRELAQRYAMATFYFATSAMTANNTTGTTEGGWRRSTGWLDPDVHICEWYPYEIGPSDLPNDPECLANGRRTLHLSNNNLVGTIPNEILLLPELMRIDLSFNSITGTIPAALFKKIRISAIKLEHNLLTGTLPSHIGGMKYLDILNLGNNLFSGSIPTQVGLLQSLKAWSKSSQEMLIVDHKQILMENDFAFLPTTLPLRYAKCCMDRSNSIRIRIVNKST